MKIEFLGTGGAITIPRPGCSCRVCAQAREKGIPYSRSGPSVFVHGPNILIDTPEEIKDQLNRSQVKDIKVCFYSHWHPDHVMGRRVWEMNWDWRNWPPQHKKTTIYLPQQVAYDFSRTLGTSEHFKYFVDNGLVNIVELRDGEEVTLGKTKIRPFRLAADYVYAFLLEGDGKRVLIAPDELIGWSPPEEVQGVDVAVIPMGIADINPLTGEQNIPETHPVLKTEATFQQTLEIVRELKASRVFMIHIEEPDGLTYDDLKVLEGKLQDDGLNVIFAYDTMLIDA